MMSKKVSIPIALLALGLLIKTTPVGPGGKRSELLLPVSTQGWVNYSKFATATSTQPSGEMAFGLNDRLLNADNTHYVVPLRPMVSSMIESIYDITDATGGTYYSPSVSRRKAVGRRLLRAAENGWLSDTAEYSMPDEDLLGIFTGLQQAEIFRADIITHLEDAMDAIEKDMKPDYWWRKRHP